MNNKFLTLYVLLILSIGSMSGQVFHSLLSNSKLQHSNHLLRQAQNEALDTISLPFFEDFSEPGMYPNSQRWADNYVYINRSFAHEPPSIGVATFDIINFDGEIYPTSGTTSFLADKLTSLPIDLSSYDASDSLYLSFFYQPQGLGWDMPDQSDSLVLKFKNQNNEWVSIWSVTGTSLHPFKQVVIPVHNPQYLYKGFQFRFANYASLGDPQQQEDAIKNDFWNLDFIVLDTNRTIADTIYQDISFFESKESLFYKYKGIPYKHFNLSQLQKDTMNYHIRNLDNTVSAVDNMRFKLWQNNTPVDYFVLGTMNVGASDIILKDFSYQQMESSPGNEASNLPNTLSDSTVFKVIQYFDAHTNAKPYYSANDTLKFYMNCFNYYAYDDGSSELGLALIENDTKLAYKIEGLKSDTLRGISILFNRYKDFGTSDQAIFNLCVWEDNNGMPGSLIYKEENVKTKYAWGIDRLAYFELEEAVFVNKTFFVGLETSNEKLYSIGYDINNHYPQQTYFWKDNWSEIPIGTPIIRPHLGDDFVYISVPKIERPQIDFRVYPNPTTQGYVYIHMGDENAERLNYQIKVFNLQGQKMMQATFSEPNYQLSTQAWAEGYYLIKISNQEGVGFRKLIKN